MVKLFTMLPLKQIRLLAPFFSVVLAGCATSQQLHPNGEIQIGPNEGSGRILFYRPNKLFGYGMRPDILLDGIKVGQSVPGTQFYVDTTIGVHRIVVPNSLYSGERALEITVKNKEILYVRTSLGGSALGGRTNVESISQSQAIQELRDIEPSVP